MGSVYPGGGLAAGGGYRQYIGYDSFVDVGALYSVRGYKKVAITGFTPNHLGERLDLEGSIVWVDATQVAFYGLGNASRLDNRTNFRINRAYVEGAAVLRPVRWLGLRLDGGFDDYTQKPGHGAAPSIEQIFSPATAPLLGDNPLYLRGEASATAYWLESPGYSRTGGLYRVAYEEFNPLRGSGGTFGFLRTQIVQHVPLLRETWVVSLRGGTESIVRKSDVVPYFLMPTLGSGDSLRGYANQRFRDRHSLLLSGELRWFPNRVGLDMALFIDAGKVAPFRSGLLALDEMKIDYGIGVRFHTPIATPLRVDLARGQEGMRIVVAAGPAF
ncbi:MAG: BamA/TamA family outer membrane protein [Acidobacteria bacterium]|nr:BamA/TamA family outer membrane protein [Acidobacteriota bacterium]